MLMMLSNNQTCGPVDRELLHAYGYVSHNASPHACVIYRNHPFISPPTNNESE